MTQSAPAWQDTLAQLFARYQAMGHAHRAQLEARVGVELARRTLSLCAYARHHLVEITEDKANRWLGFVQGILIAAGLTDIETERAVTRPLFHAIKGPGPSHQA